MEGVLAHVLKPHSRTNPARGCVSSSCASPWFRASQRVPPFQADERRIEEVHGRLIGAADAPDAGGKGDGGGAGGGSGGDQGRNGPQKGEDGSSAGGTADRSLVDAAANPKTSP